MATTKKPVTKATVKEEVKEEVKEAKKEYVVTENFTEAGKTRGYIVGEIFPRKDDPISEETYKKLLGDNAHKRAFIKEK